MGYGGAGFQIYAYQDAAHLTGKGNSGYEGSPKLTNLLNKEPWNRYTIRVSDGTVKYFANGQPVFEDQHRQRSQAERERDRHARDQEREKAAEQHQRGHARRQGDGGHPKCPAANAWLRR